jgi:hypothetical protein
MSAQSRERSRSASRRSPAAAAAADAPKKPRDATSASKKAKKAAGASKDGRSGSRGPYKTFWSDVSEFSAADNKLALNKYMNEMLTEGQKIQTVAFDAIKALKAFEMSEPGQGLRRISLKKYDELRYRVVASKRDINALQKRYKSMVQSMPKYSRKTDVMRDVEDVISDTKNTINVYQKESLSM